MLTHNTPLLALDILVPTPSKYNKNDSYIYSLLIITFQGTTATENVLPVSGNLTYLEMFFKANALVLCVCFAMRL